MYVCPHFLYPCKDLCIINTRSTFSGGNRVLLGRVRGVGGAGLVSQHKVTEGGGNPTHVLICHITPAVRHMHFIQAGGTSVFRIHTWVYAYRHTRMHTNVHTCIYTYIYKHTYMGTYIHACNTYILI